MKKVLATIIAGLVATSLFAADWISGDILVRKYSTNRTDTVINSVLSSVGTRVCRLILDGGTWTISDDVTFPTNVTVFVAAGSSLSIASGKTVTFNGGFDAGPYTVFSGSGTTGGSPDMTWRFTEWGNVTSYPMGDGKVLDMLDDTQTVSAAWSITNTASTFGDVTGANLLDKSAAETISGAYTHSANVTLDDGTGNSPSLILKDADDKTLTVIKLDTGNTTWTSTEGDFLFTPNGDDFLVEGGLTVGSSTEAGDNNLRVEGDITANGNILGDDSTVISNIATIATDTILGDGSALAIGAGSDTVAIDSSDWDIDATGAASGLGTIACDGDITLTDASDAAVITSKGASGYDGRLVLDADNGADNADTWTIISRNSDNDLVFVNHTTTNGRWNTSGDLTVTGDVDVDGNDLTSSGDLTITPGGTDVLIDGGLNVGGTTQPGDNNLRVEGTLTQVGAATFTANATFNGNIVGDAATDITGVDDATFDGLTVTNNPTFNSRYCLYSKDATTQNATEHGTATNGQAVSFTTAFAVAPQVFCTVQAASETPGAAASITVNGFTMDGPAGGTNIAWFAIGQK